MSRLRLAMAIIAGILTASGAISAYAGTLGASRWVSVVLGGLGVLQLIVVDVLQSVDQRSAAPAVPDNITHVSVPALPTLIQSQSPAPATTPPATATLPTEPKA